MAKKYLVYEVSDLCCGPGKFNYVKSFSYNPKNSGKNVDYIENTYYQGNSLKYIWLQADEEEIDDCGNLKGDLEILFQCLNPCETSQLLTPINIVQIGGFAMPKSVTNYKALQLTNCIGPTTIGALSVTGADVPYGAKIKVQAFGGFGMTRTVNASNKNITGSTRRIRNRRLIESSNNTDGYYVPWLRNRVDGQIAAGKKMIFSRKFDEGNHIFEFAANKPGPVYFSIMDEAACIRYWAVNVVSSHCYDWVAGADIAGPDTNQKVSNISDFQSVGEREEYLYTKSNLIPITNDKDLAERYWVQTDDRTKAICNCDKNDADFTFTENSTEDLITYAPPDPSNQSNGSSSVSIYDAGTPFINGSRLFSAKDKDKAVSDGVRLNLVRTPTINDRLPYVGEEMKMPLPSSMTKGAFAGDRFRRIRGTVFDQPPVPDSYADDFHGAGFAGNNTGPIDWLENDDTEFVKARVVNEDLKISTTAPTNFLPAMLEVDFKMDDDWMYANGHESMYKYVAPPIAATPKEVKVVDTVSTTQVSQATNNDSSETNYLQYEDMAGGDRISWTQRALQLMYISVCPAIDITIESRPPWGDGFSDDDDKKYFIWDYGEGTELKITAEFPDGNRIADGEGMAGAKFHFPEPETKHRDNKYFGDKAPIGKPSQPGGWARAGGGGNKHFKMYKLNAKAGENFENFGATNISVYFSWEAGATSVSTKNPLSDFDRWGPGASAAQNPFKDDEWFDATDDANNFYWDKKHIVKGNWKSHFQRDFADHWIGADEQLRGCSCVSRNVKDLIIARQPPVIDDENGDPKQVVFDELNNGKGAGIIFVDGPGQKDGDFDQLL